MRVRGVNGGRWRYTGLPNHVPRLSCPLCSLIKASVKETPSSFNSQSSRVVILLGEAHDQYWNDTVLGELRKVVPDDEKFEQGKKRIDGFKAGYGTALFFEDGAVVEQFQKNIAAYADRFPEWSTHATGMAQIHTWTTLELAGYGANLQHVRMRGIGKMVAKHKERNGSLTSCSLFLPLFLSRSTAT